MFSDRYSNDHELRPWLKSPVFHEGEDLISLAVRMAPYGLLTIDQMAKWILHVSIDQIPFDADGFRRLAHVGGYERAKVQSLAFEARAGAAVIHRGLWFSNKWVSTRHIQVAPRALAEMPDPYLKAQWRFRIFPCDLDTGELLLDVCPSCHHKLSTPQGNLCSCHCCGYDLRKATPKYLPQSVFDDARALAGTVGLTDDPPIALPAPFDTMTREDLLGSLSWLNGTILSLGSSSTFGMVQSLEVLRSWPAVLDEFIAWLPMDMKNRTGDRRNMMNLSVGAPRPLNEFIVHRVAKCIENAPLVDQRWMRRGGRAARIARLF